MARFSVLIVGLIGVLFLLPGFVSLFSVAEGFSVPLLLLIIFYLGAIIPGAAGSIISIKNTPTASKALAVSTIAAILVVLLNFYLLTSAEGTFLRYTIFGLFLLAVATYLASRRYPS